MKLLIQCLLFGYIGLLNFAIELKAQSLKSNNRNEMAFSSTIGENQGAFSLGYAHYRAIGKKQKFEIGLGTRLTSVLGSKINYTTAPAKLARTNQIPFLIVFAGQSYENWDTLQVQRPLIFSLNATTYFKYNITNRISAGFNIDLFGVSLGRNSSAILTSNAITRTESKAKPTSENLLLTGDLDRGSLNSETFVEYRFKNGLGIRLLYQFLFSEYQTTSIFQKAPDGTEVYRFRNKSNNFGLGISYSF